MKNPIYVYLIEQVNISPLEKTEHKAIKWSPFGFFMLEQEAKEFCERKGKFYTSKDCPFIKEYIREYRFTKINLLHVKV